MGSWNKYDYQRSDMQHPPQCDECVFKPQCRGIAEKYVQFYGTDEFQPISMDSLRQMDTARHFFVLEVDERLQPLVRASAPAPWRATKVFRSTRDRLIEFHYDHQSGARAILLFTPSTTTEFEMNIIGEGEFSLADGLTLVRWAEGLLAIPATDARLVAARLFPAYVESRRERLARYVQKIESRGEFSGWSLGTKAIDPNGFDAVLRIGPVDLRLAVEADPSNKPVTATFDVLEGFDPAEYAGVISEIAATLRG
jgi:hypothetical protein